MEESTSSNGEWVSQPAFRLKWDVFLNFRSADTREKFTLPLYEALVNNGVRAFMDDEGMTQGDDLKRKLPEAIDDSPALIAIISPSYASSKWCLEELAKALECGRLILPVFYHVNPSDVRRQKGTFEEDFNKLSEEKDLVRWRNAMEKTGGMKGLVVDEDKPGDDPGVIQKLVRKVLDELSKTPMDMASYIVGHKDSIDDLMRLLDVKSNGIRTLGIWGMGGIGKTTLVKALYNKILVTQFEHRCFISNVREIYEKESNGLASLQDKLRKDLSVSNEVNGTRVLVVLDDVSRLKGLANWWRKWFDEGSRIIITTRNKKILDDCRVDNMYEVKELGQSDSLRLFIYHAMRSKPSEEIIKLSERIVSLTGGLPLALEIFGLYLYDKRRAREWEDAVKKLEKVRPGDLQNVLKISFDGLDEEEKCVFLDISCLFVNLDMKLENAIDILKGCGFNAELSIKVLISRSLVKIKEDNRLWMHDQIRDMGRQIVQLENADLGKRSRLWDRDEVSNVLRHRKGTKHIQGIIVDVEKKISLMDRNSQLEEDVILDTVLFKKMARLRLLYLDNVRLKGSFKSIPCELKWLQWKHCPLDNLPSEYFPELTVIDVSDSKIKSVWDKKRLCSNKVAKNLMVMNLLGCRELTDTPDLSRHPALEKLNLEHCSAINNIHKSLGGLRELRHLNLKDCSGLVEFPNDVSGLKNLETLTLSGCSKLTTLPSDLRGLASLRELFLDKTAIKELPNTIIQLTKLEVLSIDHCRSLKKLPEHIGNLEALKTFSANRSVLEVLPDSICELENLEKLNLFNQCQSLSALPTSVGKLKSLATFWYGGGSVKEIPDSIGLLFYLKELSLGECLNLEKLPISIKGLANVVELKLYKLSIISLPECFEGLKSLQTLEIIFCKELESLPESIECALTLTTITIENSAIKKLPKSIGKLENLSWLRLAMCTELRELPDSFGELKSLHDLYITETPITKLPESFGMLSKLVTLMMPMKGCDENRKPTKLPDSFSDLSLLQELDACSWKIGKIPKDSEKLTSLETLNLGHNDFDSLPSSLRGLSVLRKLFLQNCKNLKVLPPLPSSLVELKTADCISLENISDLSNLSNLRDLNLANCGKLISVPGLECLSSLRRLHMSGCSSCAAEAKDKLTKLAVRNLYSLSWPGKEIPNWFTREKIYFSNPRKSTVTAVIIGIIVSVNRDQMPKNAKSHLSVVLGVKIKIYRSNSWIYQTAPRLEGIPNTDEDHFFLCRYVDHNQLLLLLQDGDTIKVEMADPPVGWVQLKGSGINIVFENEDDYVRNEQNFPENERTVSDKLTTFIRNLSSALDSISNI